MNLDIITLSIVLAIVYFISCIILIFLWIINPQEKGLLSWVLSAFLAFIAFLTLVIPTQPGPFHIMVNAVFVMIAMILLVMGILQFRGFVQKVEYVYLTPLFMIFTLHMFFTQNNPAQRYFLLDSVIIIGAVLCAFFMVYKTKTSERILYGFTSIVFIMIVPVFAYRWYLAVSGALDGSFVGLTDFQITRFIFISAIPWVLGYTFNLSVIVNFRTVEKLKVLTYRDYLTGLKNRRSMDIVLLSKINEGKSFYVLMIDLNNFKHVNDLYGHTTGDEVLAYIGSYIMSKLTLKDEGFRLGGDEFIVILDESSTLNLDDFVRHIRNLAHEGITFNSHHIRIESSIGFSRYPMDGTTRDELLLKADHQMYQDKRILKTNGHTT